METGAMMRIASIIEKSKNSKHDSDNGSDDLESNYGKTKYRKKKRRKTRSWNKVIMKVKSLSK